MSRAFRWLQILLLRLFDKRAKPAVAKDAVPDNEDSDKEVRVEHLPDGRRLVTQVTTSSKGGVEVQHDCPDATVHNYKPSGVNEDVYLYAGTFSYLNHRGVWDGDVRYTWRPAPRIEARGWRQSDVEDLKEALERWMAAGPDSMWIQPPELVIDMSEGTVPPQPQESATTSAMATGSNWSVGYPEQQLGNPSDLDRVTFLVPNGWKGHDEKCICDPNDLTRVWHGRTEAQGDGWCLTFDRERKMDRNAWNELKSVGGYRFTHTGLLRRLDGSTFSGDEAFDVLYRARIGLNLALGRRTTCALPVGSSKGRPVWARWRRAPVDTFSNSSHWLDETICASQIGEIVSTVLEVTSDKVKRDALAYATSYYVTAQVNVEVQLSAAIPISGLQLLSYLRFVTERGAYTRRGFEDLITEDQLRLLLNDINVDTSLPVHLSHLDAARNRLAAASGSARDALSIVVNMRNVATHPTRGRPANYSIYEWAEAGMLARHWLCLALLNAAEYVGKVATSEIPRRLGKVQDVPWSVVP